MTRSNWRGAARAALLPLLQLLAPQAAAYTALPQTEEDLVATVKAALLDRDQEVFDALINWEGAGAIKQRIVRFQIRHEFGRPIRSIRLEPFPADGLAKMEARGTLRANMDVSHRLRVEFDGPPRADGKPPVDVFLIGREGRAYRIALVVRAETAKDDD